jgi:2-oxoglutarate ferredoxin oxidoreductase subunit gamma
MNDKQQIRVCGFGGQGVILAGLIIGQAASVYEHRSAIMTQDYGPEARGGACRADVIIASEPVSYPYVDTPSILVAMSQEAYQKYITGIDKDTLVIYDSALVKPEGSRGNKMIPMPARDIAEKLGRLMVANVVMLGFLTAATGILSVEAVKQSILASVPQKAGKLNMDAFDEGFAAGVKARV